MRKKKFEKPQKGNPHQLTINQHVFPVRSIERFVGKDKMVCVYLKPKNTSFRAIPENEIFCANRTWDERAEAGYMRDIEDKFQVLAEAIIRGGIQKVGSEETKILNDFWVLWHLRAEYKDNPLPDAKLNAIAGDPSINKDQQEYLEKNHIGCILPDATIPGRDIVGMQIQLRLIEAKKKFGNEKWGIIKTHDGEFIAPDIYLKDSKTIPIIPLTPTCCLISPNDNAKITFEEVRKVNKLAVEYSKEFYFARDFSKCPL